MKPWPKRNQPNRLPPRWSHTRLPNVPWFSQAEFNFEQKDLHGPGLKVKWLAVRFYVFWLASWTHRHSQTFTDIHRCDLSLSHLCWKTRQEWLPSLACENFVKDIRYAKDSSSLEFLPPVSLILLLGCFYRTLQGKGLASGYVECIASGYTSCIASGYLNININIIILIVVVVVINNRHISSSLLKSFSSSEYYSSSSSSLWWWW